MNKIITIIALVAMAGNLASCASQKDPSNNNKRPTGAPSFTQILTEMDSNGDGKLSKSEVKGPLSTDFSKIDTDNDGFITKSEFQKAPRPQRNSRPPRNN